MYEIDERTRNLVEATVADPLNAKIDAALSVMAYLDTFPVCLTSGETMLVCEYAAQYPGREMPAFLANLAFKTPKKLHAAIQQKGAALHNCHRHGRRPYVAKNGWCVEAHLRFLLELHALRFDEQRRADQAKAAAGREEAVRA